MDFLWGSDASKSFVTTVGLVTSTGPHGENIMAAEWSFHVSYRPGRVAISLGKTRATVDNIRATKEFGLSIATSEQTSLASLAGTSTGKEMDKIAGFKELGVRFIPGKQIKASLVDDARLTAECKVITEVDTGDHVLFIGDVVEATVRTDKDPIVFNGGYRRLGDPLPKPSDEERAKQKAVMDKHKK